MHRERIAALTIFAACLVFPSCTAPSPPAAKAAYTAEQVECASRQPSKEASRACRAEVDRRWGVDGGGK
jgi:hypothetical protein